MKDSVKKVYVSKVKQTKIIGSGTKCKNIG